MRGIKFAFLNPIVHRRLWKTLPVSNYTTITRHKKECLRCPKRRLKSEVLAFLKSKIVSVCTKNINTGGGQVNAFVLNGC